ncbi:NUDIX hydrolase [Propionimicrobium sp. PCR01-08-3]|uniref:NUDIX hydrolase n=1 Tax=Propionimicrobium sp. PCR01-08-3 TaxID=3052086 RepID=UPI00255CAD84|nr:NUDIX hydrolase [Propionimicrobium sp. PCR01-08-3]WIY83928.1 NUDIX hydrolase [Propionimicrobium sp. PCR01-08-3]
MTTALSNAKQAPQPTHPRDPGDAWVETPTGERYWGRFGAAGLLAFDPEGRVLLQHRAEWSHHGGTWGLPGGARHEGESAIDGALRESNEEAGVPREALTIRATNVLDRKVWSYTTVVADVTTPFEPVISDAESAGLAWVPVEDVTTYPLHPGFAASWSTLKAVLDTQPVVVVDAANVVGSTPNGWWHDRAGAAAQLISKIAALAETGVAAQSLDLPLDHWFPEFVVVLEGDARAALGSRGAAGLSRAVEEARTPYLRVVSASGLGDDAIVAEASRLAKLSKTVTVASSDRELTSRVQEAGSGSRRVSWLLDLLSQARS